MTDSATPWTGAHLAFPVLHHLPEFVQTDTLGLWKFCIRKVFYHDHVRLLSLDSSSPEGLSPNCTNLRSHQTGVHPCSQDKFYCFCYMPQIISEVEHFLSYACFSYAGIGTKFDHYCSNSAPQESRMVRGGLPWSSSWPFLGLVPSLCSPFPCAFKANFPAVFVPGETQTGSSPSWPLALSRNLKTEDETASPRVRHELLTLTGMLSQAVDLWSVFSPSPGLTR